LGMLLAPYLEVTVGVAWWFAIIFACIGYWFYWCCLVSIVEAALFSSDPTQLHLSD
jgi:hypothetical protein